MFKTVKNAWAIPELRKKIMFTIFALLIFRLGASVPVPWIDTKGLQDYLNAMSGSIFGLINAMSGNAFSMATVFALWRTALYQQLHHHPAPHRRHPRS